MSQLATNLKNNMFNTIKQYINFMLARGNAPENGTNKTNKKIGSK